MQPTRAGPAPVLVQHCAAQPTAVATVFNLLPVGRRACARRARARSGHLLLTRSPLEAPEGATHSPSPPAPPLSSPGPRSLLCFPPAHTTERSSPSSSPYPWPPATPSLADAPRSSASTPSSSPPIHSPPEALHRRHRRRLLPRTRRPSSSNSPAPDRPRPRRASPRHRRESLTLSPNSACSPPCRSAVPHEHRSHRPPLLLHA